MNDWLKGPYALLVAILLGSSGAGWASYTIADRYTEQQAARDWETQRRINESVADRLDQIAVRLAELGGPKDPMNPRVMALEKRSEDVANILARTAITLKMLEFRMSKIEEKVK